MFRILSSLLLLAAVSPVFAKDKTDLKAQKVSAELVSISGEFNEAWAGSESFRLFAGSPMSCKDVPSVEIDKSIECDLAATQLVFYPEKGNPFGVFFDTVVLQTLTKNRKKVVSLHFTGLTERVPGFPDGLEVQFTLRHYEGFPKRQWGTLEIPEYEISRLVRAKLK
jgi:hypothetical protein